MKLVSDKRCFGLPIPSLLAPCALRIQTLNEGKEMDGEQKYRCNFKLRRKGQAALDQHHCELKSEDFDSDEEFCLAVASELLETLKEDRDYLAEQEGE